MPSLYEKYRPQSLSEIVGHASAVDKIKSVLSLGWGGRSWFISGFSGGGKTTLARIIAATGADDFFINEVDYARDLTPPRIRDMFNSLHMSAWGKGGRAIIINEAHGLRTDAIECLLTSLESIPGHTCVVFTTTKDGQARLFDDSIDAAPLLSRCIPIELSVDEVQREFPLAVQRIARAEKLDGRPLSAYRELADRHAFNMRAMLQAVETGLMKSSNKERILKPKPKSDGPSLSAAQKATLTRWGVAVPV